MSPPLPSPAATWLLECVLPPRNRDAVLGDLVEEYWVRLQSQPRAAAAHWYWGQVLKSVARLAGAALVSGQWYRTAGIGIAMLVCVSLIESLINGMVASVLPLGPGPLMVVSVLIGLGSMVAGGYVAAWIKPAAALALAAAHELLVVALVVTRGDESPLWFQIAFLILTPAATLAGGILYIRRAKRDGRPAR